MDYGEQTTGTRDEHYNLISVLYHALHGAENCDTYALDAEAAGRDDQAGFFREAQAMQMDLAERAKGLLGIVEAVPGAGSRVEPGTISGGMPPGPEIPPEVGPGVRPEDVSRETVGEPPPPPTTGEPPDVPLGPEEARPREEAVRGDAPPSTEEIVQSPGQEGSRRQPEEDREEDKGLLDRAKDAILGEEEESPRRSEGTDRPDRR